MKGHADKVHAVAVRVPFWHVDNTGEEIMMRDTDGHPLITFHGVYASDMAKWLSLLSRTAGMALADLIRASSGSAEEVPGRDAAFRLLQEMRLEEKPTRYRR